jgi:hypothetical protein
MGRVARLLHKQTAKKAIKVDGFKYKTFRDIYKKYIQIYSFNCFLYGSLSNGFETLYATLVLIVMMANESIFF